MRFIISTLPFLLALSTFTTAKTTDGTATSADIAVSTNCAADNALKECLHSMPASTSTSTSTASPSGYTETDGNANEVDADDHDDDDDDDDDEDSGIKEGYLAKSYSGLEASMTPSEGGAVGYTTREWGLVWGCFVGVGLGVLL